MRDFLIFRVRFHGRGGQGIKTASRILGSAFFGEGLEVQDAPRYGAERRGAPIFAYVRASPQPIAERGIIALPDLVVVADDSVVAVPAAGVVAGIRSETVVLLRTAETAAIWRDRLGGRGHFFTLHPSEEQVAAGPWSAVGVAGAAARLVGVIQRETLEQAVRDELSSLPEQKLQQNVELALAGYDRFEEHAGVVQAGALPDASAYEPPHWIDLSSEPVPGAAPAVHAAATSNRVPTGLWRTQRPILEKEHCHKCIWLCGSMCPDGVIARDGEGFPQIDYEHCKGCMVCVAQCPNHAFAVVAESEARAADQAAAEQPGGRA